MAPFFKPTAIVLLALILTAGCTGSQAQSDGSARGVEAQSGAKKRITVAVMGDPTTLSGKLNSSGTGNVPGVDALEELVNAGLANFDNSGEMRALLSEAVPTLENGQWRLLPDGRMETTWKLKPNIFWHDGTPFTADDLVFSARVGQDKDIALEYVVAYDSIERVEASDARTFTIYWKQPYIEANTMFTRAAGAGRALPVPKHVLERAFEEDKANFTQHEFWTTAYVGTGPFKLREWLRGSNLVLDANDRYVLGKPRLDEIEVKFFPDPRVVGASILAGAVDATIGRGLAIEQGVQIRDLWRDGKMDVRSSNLITSFVQFLDPSPAIIGNVQFRRALLHGMDRQQLVDTLMGGLSQPGHSFIAPDDSLYKEVEASIVRYDFDPRRAGQLIEELAFVKGADGLFRDGGDQRLAVEIRATSDDDVTVNSALTIADYWQRIGVAAEPAIIPVQRARDREYRATFPAFDIRQTPNETGRLFRFHSTRIALPENRFVGENNSRYMNAELDGLLERYFVTIPLRERNQVLAQIMHHFTDQVVFMGLFYNMEPTLVANRLKNLTGRHQYSTQSWNAHEWDLS